MGYLFFTCIAFILVGCSGRRSVNTRNLCNRDPPNIAGRRTPGDNGLRIQVLGHSEKYTPGQVYTISINGTYPNQRLVGFMLVAVPLNAQDETTAMGTFQLIDTAQTKFASECPHVVTHTNLRAKAGVDVLWTAPAPRVGCIEFRATVIERNNTWFKDDGALTREFCEDTGTTESERSAELTPDCCACGSAKYQMTFEGKWSQQSHPKDYPTQRRLLHWSNIVGASHSKNFMVWQYGDYATKGVKEVCELGYPRTAEQEIQSHSQEVRSIIKTSGIWWSEPHGINQKRDGRFSTDRRRHLVSMLTMVGPSPDWCVGISAVDLCLPNCTWTKEITFDLFPWDAGTDDGISFMSPNKKSNPQQKIHRITNTFPNNVASPFYGREPVKALATLKIERLSGNDGGGSDSSSSCLNDDTDDSDVDIIGGGGGGGVGGVSEMDKQKLMMQDGKCALSAWDDWSGCSVTCGVGQRSRKRTYLNPMVDESMCGLPVIESENCIGLENECETIEEDCAVTQWSNWSPCSVSCGKGTRERRRFYLTKEDMVRCNRTTEEVAMCAAAILDCDAAKAHRNLTAICSLPSLAGPCRGDFERWYFDVQMQKCLPFVYGGCRGNENRFETMDECTEACSLSSDRDEPVQQPTQSTVAARAKCSLPSVAGTCRGNFERWYFDVQMQKCLPFAYGGCGGNDNRFETMDECTETCSLFEDTETTHRALSIPADCSLPSVTGPCRANFERWYFDVQMQKCLPFVYGGCNGNENRFETMDECTKACSLSHDTEDHVQEPTQRTITSRAKCSLPSVAGTCRGNFEKWYFDVQMQKCLPFAYGGCGGNDNRFETMDECTETCSLSDDTDERVQEPTQRTLTSSARCSLPSVAGTCRGNFEKWYFDVQMQKCLPFAYGGCGGNDNRFETMDECTETCSLSDDTEERVQEPTQRTITSRARCSLPSVTGSCRGNFERWYFDVQMQKCLPFVYGGCHGNENRFETMDECTETCALSKDTEDRVQEPTQRPNDSSAKCSLPSVTGPCRGNFERWYFDVQMQKCLPFVYGGCHGNENRFETMDECTEACALSHETEENVQEPTQRTTSVKQEICHLPRDPGPCRSNFESWYFDTAMQKCLPFSYGGCFGNQNRFSTAEDCFERCIESAEQPVEVTVPSIRTVRPSKEISANSRTNHPTSKGSLRKPHANGKSITNKTSAFPPVDCVISPWSDWSSCSASCGTGFHVRQRMIKREPENGGRSCPTGLEKRKKCKLPPCDASSSCQLGPWGQWSPCSKTCGSNGIQQRERQMLNNGNVQAKCKLHMQRRICTEEPCPNDSRFL